MPGLKVFVAGHRGMVGSALVRRLRASGLEPLCADRAALDLRRQDAVETWMAANRPDVVIVAAAKVGGILANDSFPADFLRDNLAIETNLIHAAHLADVDRLVFLGSSCIYPRLAPQPIPESSLLTGPLEPTNEWYAIAKIAGVKLCQAYRRQHRRRYISVMPCNLYGPRDNFDLQSSHVLPALIRKFDEAKARGAPSVTIWGTGTPLREFLHVDDLARAVLFCAESYDGEEPINCGSAEEISIAGLAELVREIVGFDGGLAFDRSKPDGTPRKLMDSGRLRALGWAPTIALRDGVAAAYAWYRDNIREPRQQA
jgi:GDP-L-fucose synthase